MATTGGGPVDVSYLDGCTGSATTAPTYEVTFTSGDTFDLLRFYFVEEQGRDATLIISDPTDDYVCGDDSYSTFNPTVDFESPADGTYDIWVGAFGAGTDVGGTLFVTETDSNHP